jgi:hypothetical protein
MLKNIIGMPIKKDGSKDKRYVDPQILKSNGTKDKRYNLMDKNRKK